MSFPLGLLEMNPTAQLLRMRIGCGNIVWRNLVLTYSWLLAGCQHIYQETPYPIGADEICVRNLYVRKQACEIFVQQANGEATTRTGLWYNAWQHLYPVRLPAGRNVVEICVMINHDSTHGGLLEGWEVDLPGGREYVLAAIVSDHVVEVWFEDKLTGEPVTERRTIGIAADEEMSVIR